METRTFMDKKLAIIIDNITVLRDTKNLNKIHRVGQISVRNSYTNYLNSHTIKVAESFTTLNYPIIIYNININNESLFNLLSQFINHEIKYPIYMPFGLSYLDKKLAKLLNKFDQEQLHVSFPNKKQLNYLALAMHSNVTIVAKKSDKKIIKMLNTMNQNIVYFRSKSSNSLLLAKYHLYKHKYNKQGLHNMSGLIHNNNDILNIQPNELFAFQLFDGNVHEIDISPLPTGVFYEDGFIYGKTEEKFDIKFSFEGQEYTLYFDVLETNEAELFLQVGPAWPGWPPALPPIKPPKSVGYC